MLVTSAPLAVVPSVWVLCAAALIPGTATSLLNPSRMVARGQGGPTLFTAREAIARALSRSELSLDTVKKVASQALYTWTDFPEYGITVRSYPQPESLQCTHRSVEGRQCQRTVSAVPNGARILCWQHS